MRYVNILDRNFGEMYIFSEGVCHVEPKDRIWYNVPIDLVGRETYKSFLNHFIIDNNNYIVVNEKGTPERIFTHYSKAKEWKTDYCPAGRVCQLFMQ